MKRQPVAMPLPTKHSTIRATRSNCNYPSIRAVTDVLGGIMLYVRYKVPTARNYFFPY
jgi:hypothetical protein